MGNQAYSSWSLRGWLLLAPFGIEFDSEVVPLYDSSWDDFLETYHPAATVPVLCVGEGEDAFTLWDSLSIAEFLHEHHPLAGIWPADHQARAIARCLCAEMHSGYTALRAKMPMNVRRDYRSVVADVDTQQDVDRIVALWGWTSAQWGGAGPYLFGSDFSAADAFYAPVASRFRTYRVPLPPAAQAYADALLEHPATVDFHEAGKRESWVLAMNELDAD